MKLNEIYNAKIANFLNEFIKNENKGEYPAYYLERLHFSDEIQCWMATINQRFTTHYSNALNEGETNVDDNYTETFLGKNGVLSYTFDEKTTNRLSSEWTNFLSKVSAKDQGLEF